MLLVQTLTSGGLLRPIANTVHTITWIHAVSERVSEIKKWEDRLCNSLYDMMIWDDMQDTMHAVYSGVSRTYTTGYSIHVCYPVSLYTHHCSVCFHHCCISVHPLLLSSFSWSLYHRTPAIAQSSIKLSGGGGEKRIFPPHCQIMIPSASAHIYFTCKHTLLTISKSFNTLYSPRLPHCITIDNLFNTPDVCIV